MFPPIGNRISVIRTPLQNLPVPAAPSGYRSSERLKRENNYITWALILTVFSSALKIMDRVERNVLPLDSDPILFRSSFTSDCTMLSVTGAIITQIGITAMVLPSLSDVHWTARGAFVTTLVLGCLSVFFATSVARNLSSLSSADDVRDWLSKPASKQAHAEFERTVGPRLRAARTATADEKDVLRAAVVRFLQENRWTTPSFYSCAMLSAPSILLNTATGAFLCGLGIYLGSVWSRGLDPEAGPVAVRAVMICYIVGAVCGLALFFGSSNRKQAELKRVRRWMEVIEAKPRGEVKAADVETGRNGSDADPAPSS